MTTHKLLVITAATLQLLAAPVVAQAGSLDENAHHYEGGPKTEVPHMMKHPKSPQTANTAAPHTTNGHHYNGGPKTVVPHHMGDLQ